MSIKMTIEVSPEQAVRIAEILGSTGTFQGAPTTAPTAVPDIPAVPTAPATVSSLPTAAASAAMPTAASVVPVVPPAVPVVPAAQPAVVPTVPTAAAAPAAMPTAVRKYTADELSIASRPIVEAGRQQELLDLLHSFTFTDANGVVRNVQNIREMPEELFPAFANGIRQLGGRI